MGFVVALAVGAVIFGVALFFAKRRFRKTQERNPRITKDEVQLVFDTMQSNLLPHVRPIPKPDLAPEPLESRLGGAPWSEMGGTWPLSRSGAPYLFLAQVNFADLPSLPGYPTKGLLQVFVEREGRGLSGGDDGTDKSHALRWFPNPTGGALLPVPAEQLDPKGQPFTSEVARERGLALGFDADDMPPSPYVLPIARILPDSHWRLPADDEASEMLSGIEPLGDELAEKYGPHRIGGHPTFTQEDFRYDEALADLDRVLLHLGFDEHVCIGDAGEINLMIRADDLAHRRFDKAYYYWDCG